MQQWEIDLRERLNKELEDGCYDISTEDFMCMTGKSGYIEFIVALHREVKSYTYSEKTINESGVKGLLQSSNSKETYNKNTSLTKDTIDKIIDTIFNNRVINKIDNMKETVKVQIVNQSTNELPKYETICSAGMDIRAYIPQLDNDRWWLLENEDAAWLCNSNTITNDPNNTGLLRFKNKGEAEHYITSHRIRLFTPIEHLWETEEQVINIAPNCSAIIGTGNYVAIPLGYEIQVRSRSGLAIKQGLFVLNTPGTIDSDYRGEIGVILYNTSNVNRIIRNGDRVAQLIIKEQPQLEWEIVKELPFSDRGTGGFGHTGGN